MQKMISEELSQYLILDQFSLVRQALKILTVPDIRGIDVERINFQDDESLLKIPATYCLKIHIKFQSFR